MLSDILKVYTTTQVTQLLNARKSPGEENDTSSTAEPVSARSLFRSLVEEDPTQSVMDLDMSSQDCYRQTPDCASMSSAPELDCTMDVYNLVGIKDQRFHYLIQNPMLQSLLLP